MQLPTLCCVDFTCISTYIVLTHTHAHAHTRARARARVQAALPLMQVPTDSPICTHPPFRHGSDSVFNVFNYFHHRHEYEMHSCWLPPPASGKPAEAAPAETRPSASGSADGGGGATASEEEPLEEQVLPFWLRLVQEASPRADVFACSHVRMFPYSHVLMHTCAHACMSGTLLLAAQANLSYR